MKKYNLFQYFLLLISISCVERFIVPEDIGSQDTNQFGAGDTTFLQIKPVWGSAYGFDDPEDISIAQDGRIFVADKGNNSIIVLNQNGDRPQGFQALLDLKDSMGENISPIDVDIDKKMNIFFIDGSQRIFIWNQYWNDVNIDQVSIGGTFTHNQTNIDTVLMAETDVWQTFLNDSEWSLTSTQMSNDARIIDSLLAPHLFYDGDNDMNKFLDMFYQSGLSDFTAITAPSDQENMIYVSDSYGGTNNQYRIVKIDFYRSLLLELSTGEYVWAYTGRFGGNIKGYGTGAGTVNRPLSLDVDYEGNLYYTQSGDYFPVHMIIPNFSGDFDVYTSGFQPEADDIMDADLFFNATDIAVDDDRNIYIVDNINADITVFDSYGNYFKKAGYGSDSVKVMQEPVAVAIDQNGVVYACDRMNGSIYRFTLSNNLNEDIKPED